MSTFKKTLLAVAIATTFPVLAQVPPNSDLAQASKNVLLLPKSIPDDTALTPVLSADASINLDTPLTAGSVGLNSTPYYFKPTTKMQFQPLPQLTKTQFINNQNSAPSGTDEVLLEKNHGFSTVTIDQSQQNKIIPAYSQNIKTPVPVVEVALNDVNSVPSASSVPTSTAPVINVATPQPNTTNTPPPGADTTSLNQPPLPPVPDTVSTHIKTSTQEVAKYNEYDDVMLSRSSLADSEFVLLVKALIEVNKLEIFFADTSCLEIYDGVHPAVEKIQDHALVSYKFNNCMTKTDTFYSGSFQSNSSNIYNVAFSSSIGKENYLLNLPNVDFSNQKDLKSFEIKQASVNIGKFKIYINDLTTTLIGQADNFSIQNTGIINYNGESYSFRTSTPFIVAGGGVISGNLNIVNNGRVEIVDQGATFKVWNGNNSIIYHTKLPPPVKPVTYVSEDDSR